MAIMCHCNGVRERTIQRALRQGAASLGALQSACGAGTQCGGCQPALLALLEQHRESTSSAVSVAAFVGAPA